jgi:hypothetical protein
MPAPITYAHRLVKRQAEMRRSKLKWLRPDAKSQLSFHYDEAGQPVAVDAVVLSTQHDPEISQKDLREAVMEEIIKPVLPSNWMSADTKVYINPTGQFIIGGPVGDCGLTGRKIIVDTYGGMARHGGGAFSGKDPSKVDRSAAYAGRYVAKNVVAAGLAERCEIQVSYAIGVAEPTSISVNTFGTGKWTSMLAGSPPWRQPSARRWPRWWSTASPPPGPPSPPSSLATTRWAGPSWRSAPPGPRHGRRQWANRCAPTSGRGAPTSTSCSTPCSARRSPSTATGRWPSMPPSPIPTPWSSPGPEIASAPPAGAWEPPPPVPPAPRSRRPGALPLPRPQADVHGPGDRVPRDVVDPADGGRRRGHGFGDLEPDATLLSRPVGAGSSALRGAGTLVDFC